MRSLFILSTFFLSQSIPPTGLLPYFIDPTGTYILMGSVKNNRITGHSGEIRVQLLDSHQIALCFYINKGYPGYESGSFIDTLAYNDSNARYSPGKDSSCIILFYFHRKMVEIMEIYADPPLCRGFANGVLISAVFDKTSSDKPIIQDLSAHGISP
ncbi:MAG TPA: hypothetical protein VF939_04060 [Puia sp.]